MTFGTDMNHHYNNNLYAYLKITSICCSAISTLSSTIIIISYIKFHLLRSLAFKFIFYMSIADLISSLARFLSIISIFYQFEESLCKIQAFVINWFQLASLTWTVVISWSAWCTVIRNYNVLNVREIYFLLIGFMPGGFIAIIPIITDSYGPTDVWCWVEFAFNSPSLITTTIFEVYLPVCIALFLNIFFVVRVLLFIKNFFKESEMLQDVPVNEISGNSSVTLLKKDLESSKRLLLIPFSIFIIWVFALIHRIYNSYDDNSVVLVTFCFLYVIMMSCSGLINFLVFGLTRGMRKAYLSIICPSKSIKIKENGESMNVLLMQNDSLQRSDSEHLRSPFMSHYSSQLNHN